jgi:hypothetical protein
MQNNLYPPEPLVGRPQRAQKMSAQSSTTARDAPSRLATISSVAWVPNGDLDHPGWIAQGRRLGSIGRCSQWWVGDWLRYGSTRWGEKYAEAAKITGYDPKSLRNIAYIASRYELSRRRDNLSWSHHAELAMLDPAEQDEWLDRASQDRLSVSDLRMELRSHDRGSKHRTDDNSTGEAAASVTCPNCGHAIPLPSEPLSSGTITSRTPAVVAA